MGVYGDENTPVRRRGEDSSTVRFPVEMWRSSSAKVVLVVVAIVVVLLVVVGLLLGLPLTFVSEYLPFRGVKVRTFYRMFLKFFFSFVSIFIFKFQLFFNQIIPNIF